MKKPPHIPYVISIFLLICVPISIAGQDPFQSYKSKDALESDVQAIINDFDDFLKDMGVQAPYIPGVTIETGPFLIKWDEQNKSVILPYWNELLDEQKELFRALKDEEAEIFFLSLFNWFFIPHELGHFINPMEDSLSPYKREEAANEFALAFFLSQEGNEDKLDYIKVSLPDVLKRLPEMDFNGLSEEEYFNKHYSQLGRNPFAYGYYQFNFILSAFEKHEDLNIRKYFSQLE